MGDRLLLADRTDKKCDRNWNWEGDVGRGMVGEGCGRMGIPPGGGRLRPTELGETAGGESRPTIGEGCGEDGNSAFVLILLDQGLKFL